jgi:hypothetical protein
LEGGGDRVARLGVVACGREAGHNMTAGKGCTDTLQPLEPPTLLFSITNRHHCPFGSVLVSTKENIFVISMMRSGHHAVLNWFARNQLRPIMHFNDCRIECGVLRPDPPNLVMYYDGAIGRYLLNEPPSRLEDLSKDCATTIFSFEERDPGYIVRAAEIAQPTKIILVVRDAFNFVASCMKHAEKYPGVKAKIIDTMASRLDIWLNHARELQEGSDGIRSAINYNFWFSRKSYRDAVASRYGFINHDIGVEEVMLFGHGSSFDDHKYADQASRMGVLNRWEEYRNDPQFRSYITREVAELSQMLFEIEYENWPVEPLEQPSRGRVDASS